MKRKNAVRSSALAEEGMALVITLVFIVLLSGVIVAFFSRATFGRKLSDSSSNQNNAEQLARSALEVIVGDLRQEIVNGSTATQTAAGAVYVPTTNFDVVPMRSGVPKAPTGGSDPIPNLIRRSVRSDAIAPPGIASRASAVNSYDDASINGRKISLERWNQHYLIPLANPNGTAKSTTPVADFVAPDWVYVTEQGPQVLTTPSASTLGRYAYAIYDEGGLLDVNVAGYPSTLSTDKAGGKGLLAYADLTQIGLTKQDIDNLVGWRNYASANAVGTFGSLTVPNPQGFYTAMAQNTNGFMTVGTTVVGGRTDQNFVSRQALLAFRDTANFPQNALQYLGTFSRDIEQPSFVPNPSRPAIQSNPTTNTRVKLGTGNDAYGLDRGNDPKTDINPPFLSVTTQQTDGSVTPVVRKRFPLSRLGLLLNTATASKSQDDSIYRYFGIYRGSANQPWIYDHGNSTDILRLSQITGRDPDFFELLKAAINVGCLGKGAWYDNVLTGSLLSNPTEVKNPQYNTPNASQSQLKKDTSTAMQLLQIGANIIDQYDADGFPTRIAFSGNSTNVVSGIEDLPYMYRVHFRPVNEATALKLGKMFIEPELWNPHASNGLHPSNAPKSFRFRADKDSGYSITSRTVYTDGSYKDITASQTLTGPSPGLLFNAGEGNGFNGFREPTFLAELGKPAGTGLAPETPSIGMCVEGESGLSLVGVCIFDIPWVKDVQQVLVGGPGPGGALNSLVHFYLEYNDGGQWIVYDEQDFDLYRLNTDIIKTVAPIFSTQGTAQWRDTWMSGTRADPRTSRWGMLNGQQGYFLNPNSYVHVTDWADSASASAIFANRLGRINDFAMSRGDDPNAAPGYANFANPPDSTPNNIRGLAHGYFTANNVLIARNGVTTADSFGNHSVYMRDPDGIARRAMGGYAFDNNNGGGNGQPAGLPMVTGNNASRPVVLNRPFRSVAELGNVFSGSVWKNLDFSFPESGYAALLDVFCMNEVEDDAVVAGRVNLNTRQPLVIQALISGVIQDDLAAPTIPVALTQVAGIAQALVQRTTSSAPMQGPLMNRSELVGRYTGSGSNNPDPDQNYNGFASDIGKVQGVGPVPRLREAAMRGLVDSGTTRTWNLMIDVIAQSGKFPPTANSIKDFAVEGERHCWLHIAIDRYTGKILDWQIETVSE